MLAAAPLLPIVPKVQNCRRGSVESERALDCERAVAVELVRRAVKRRRDKVPRAVAHDLGGKLVEELPGEKEVVGLAAKRVPRVSHCEPPLDPHAVAARGKHTRTLPRRALSPRHDRARRGADGQSRGGARGARRRDEGYGRTRGAHAVGHVSGAARVYYRTAERREARRVAREPEPQSDAGCRLDSSEKQDREEAATARHCTMQQEDAARALVARTRGAATVGCGAGHAPRRRARALVGM